MSKLNALRSASNLGDLARLLQFRPRALAYILYKQSAAAKYKTFEIPKRNGGTRVIKAPIDALKLLQQRLSILLQDCADEINGAKNRKDRISHGFKRRRSIITNARRHRNRRYVFNIDLEDFFPSINFGRVRGYFIRNRIFALDEDVATVIAQIACHENALPQGSPCSPAISNLIAHVLDMHLVRLAATVGCTYSRYADDLTFSTNKKLFPAEIAEQINSSAHLWVPGAQLKEVIEYSGFRINSAKTHMQYKTSRQEVTGLVVNNKINVRREYRHTVRAMVHSVLNTGSFEVDTTSRISSEENSEHPQGTLEQLHGMLGFIDSIDLYNRNNTAHLETSRRLSSEVMYRQFLIYKEFYAASAPVIICEGETDNIYLTHAIRSLAMQFPELAEVTSEGKLLLRVRLYKYPRSSTARIIGLRDGGSGSLAKFIATYRKDTDKFKAPGQKAPVIILYDNDAAASKIRSTIRENARVTVRPNDPFVHVVRNLYAVPTPLLGTSTESKIEDFFDTTVKATVVDGKTFNGSNDFDVARHYGKKVFAELVVRKRADSIDFDRFRPLLTNVESVIKFHATAVSGTPNAVVGSADSSTGIDLVAPSAAP